MKKYSFKNVLISLIVGFVFISIATCLSLAIKFFFRIFLLMLKYPVEAMGTVAILLIFGWIAYELKNAGPSETK